NIHRAPRPSRDRGNRPMKEEAGRRRRETPRADRLGDARADFAFSNEFVSSQRVIFSLTVTYPDPSFEGGLPEAFCRRGTGGAPASEGLTQPSSPGRTRAASSATRSRPGPTTVKGIKAKMPRWRAARRGA